MLRLPAFLVALGALPALAETPMTGSEFEAYVSGKTLFYGVPGAPYGAEQYLSGRRVIWTFLDGSCKDGSWYEQNGMICFVYEGPPDEPQCWTFFDTPQGLTARFENDPASTELVETRQGQDPLICPGPEVGV